MGNYSLFDFMGNVSQELAELGRRIEEQLYEQPHSALMQIRLFSEQLVKKMSQEEGLEDVFPLKHSERIHKLFRQDIVNEDIYIKLEWIRKNGNKAAHNIDGVEINDVLQGHKHLFDICVWYMQIYISYEFEAPTYKLPVRSKGINQDTLDDILTPILDEKLQKIDEIHRVLSSLKDKRTEKKESVFNEEADEKVETQLNRFPLLKYLKDNNLEYIDNRQKKGALWVIGDWSISKKLFPLKEHKIYFRYSKKGGRATKNKPAWFLLNKNLVDISDNEG